MADRSSIMPEQVALFEREPDDHVWSGRLTTTDAVADLGATLIVNGLVTPARVATTSLIAPESLSGAGERISSVTLKSTDELLASQKSGNPAAPAYWPIGSLGESIGIDFERLPGEYSSWRFCTELYVLKGGATYLLASDLAVRHRVLTEDEVSLTFVQRLMPFMAARPEDLTGTMVFLTSVPSRLAALGGLRGYRRALIECGLACAELSAAVAQNDQFEWIWETEFYDDAAMRLIGVDGVERVVTHIGYQRTVETAEVEVVSEDHAGLSSDHGEA